MAIDNERTDLPVIDSSTQPFWEAAREGVLLIRRCNACNEAFFYPRPFCPSCWSPDVGWEAASGMGQVYTYSIVYSNDLPPFSGRLPYIAAVVDLDEGPRMMTNVVGCGVTDVHVGMRVTVAFEEETDEVTLPRFRPFGIPTELP